MIENHETLARTERHEHALRAIADGIAAAHPARVLDDAVALDGDGLVLRDRTYSLTDVDDLLVLGGGKAAGQMASVLESTLGDAIDGGVVVTDDPVETDRIDVVAGTHPLPSEANVVGTGHLLDFARSAGEDDLVIVLLSGGASALLCAPVAGVPLADYRELTERLVHSGAPIEAINAVRKHVSASKGGQLATTLAPATTVGLIVSDVVGNALESVASGPTAPDPTTYADAAAVATQYDVSLPETVAAVLDDGRAGDRPETPADASDFAHVRNHVVAESRTAVDAAATTLRDCGYTPRVLSTRIEGEARTVGTVHVGVATECLATERPFSPPVALVSGGETTVTVAGNGTGGPNQEFALSAALAMDGTDLVVAAVDTDGVDGPTDAAGAIVDGETVPDDRRTDARAALRRNDAHGYLTAAGGLVQTGQTGTNVNDLRIVLVGSP